MAAPYAGAAMSASGVPAVLLITHGTVSQLEDLPEFLKKIRRGRPASPELVAEMRERYERIGGSPLALHSEEQRAELETRLGLPVYLATRFGEPSFADAVTLLLESGSRDLVLLPLAPYSVELYCQEASRALSELAPSGCFGVCSVGPWGCAPGLIAAHAARIRSHSGPALERGARLLLTAHSLPTRVIAAGDKYAEEVAASAAAIERSLGQRAQLVYQSQGADGGDWLGPTLREALNQAKSEGITEVVCAPFGFLAEHVETLYDLDIEASAMASELGLRWERVAALGSDPFLLETLAELVMTALRVEAGA